MRRAMAGLLALTVLAFSGLVCAHISVNASRDAVEIYETALCGDSSAASGLKVRAPMYMDGRLFWDTEFEPGSDSAPHTDFRFSAQQEYHDSERDYGGLYVTLMMNMGGGGNYGTEFDFENGSFHYEENFYRVYGDILNDVASRTGPGQEHTERVELTGWIDYVPLQFDLDLPGLFYMYDDGQTSIETNRGSTKELGTILAEYFRIPLTGSLLADIGVTRDKNGELVGWQISGVSGNGPEDSGYDKESAAAVSAGNWERLDITSYSVATDDACYFAFDQWNQPRDEKRVDFSALPGGRGVYRLPFKREGGEGEMTRLYLDDIETVLPVADDEYVELLDTDGERLLMFTVGDGKLYLTQARLPELTQVKKTLLAELAEPEGDMYDGYRRVSRSDGVYCIETTGGRVLLLESVNGGDYELRLNVPADFAGAEESVESLLWARGINLSYSESSLGWDGERLAMARWCFMNSHGYYDERPACVLRVYDETGLLYCGLYESSLCIAPAEEYRDAVRAFGSLELYWE